MVSKKVCDDKSDKAKRSPKGTLKMSLEMATMLLAFNSLTHGNEANIKAFLSRSESLKMSPDEKCLARAEMKNQIERAAEMVSVFTHIDTFIRTRSAENLICLVFIIQMLLKGEPKEHKVKAYKEMMGTVRKQVERHKLVERALRSYAALAPNERLTSDEVRTKYFDKMRSKALDKWSAYKRQVAHSKPVKDRLIRVSNEYLGL